MISDIGFIGLKYSIGTALKYWEYVAFKYWDRDRRDIFGIGTALVPYTLLLGRTCEGHAGKFVLWLAVEFDANLSQPRILQHPRFPPVSTLRHTPQLK